MNNCNEKVLVTGGARSGKSRFGLEWGKKFPEPKVFLATATPVDREMLERIRRHFQERGPEWITVEEPVDIEEAIRLWAPKVSCLLVDCITIWLTNLLMEGFSDRKIESRTRILRDEVLRAPCSVLLVTNEVGWGIVPNTRLGRRFRDLAGKTNQFLAQEMDEVVLMVSGIPLVIKSKARSQVPFTRSPSGPEI
jgi:adenosylcobinamide kinase/adenosylcobinamide-phosphate guanylyltransferase